MSSDLRDAYEIDQFDDPPVWLARFVHDEVRPFILQHREAVLEAWVRWLTFHRMSDNSEPTVGLPLPPPISRDLSPDERLTALLAIHDACRDERERLISNAYLEELALEDRVTFQILHGIALELSDAHLPELQKTLRIASVALDDCLAQVSLDLQPPPPLMANHSQQDESLPKSWEGDGWDDLQAMAKRLLRYMTARERADLRDLCPMVWEKDYADVTSAAISNAISKANNFLARHGEKRVLEKVRSEPVIRWR